MAGHKAEAEAAIPEEYLVATTMAGDEAFVKDRIEAYRAAGVTRLSVSPVGPEPLKTIETVKEWAK